MNKSIYRLLKKIIDSKVQGTDIFKHNGSTWIIFENDKQWVIELTEDGTLWYNYNFFQDIFELVGLDVVENQNYITKWVEETIINGVNYTGSNTRDESHQVEDTIQNGVKETKTPGEDGDILGVLDFLSDNNTVNIPQLIDDIIYNGVKHTEYGDWLDGDERFDDIIQNGVKHTVASDCLPSVFVEDTIQNGVKHTEKSLQIDGSCVVEDVIQNGIKETHDDVYHHKGRVGGVIKNGIKETKLIDYSDNTEFIVNGVISRGISI